MHDATFTQERAAAERERDRARTVVVQAEIAYEAAKLDVVETVTKQDKLEEQLSTEFRMNKVRQLRADFSMATTAADRALQVIKTAQDQFEKGKADLAKAKKRSNRRSHVGRCSCTRPWLVLC